MYTVQYVQICDLDYTRSDVPEIGCELTFCVFYQAYDALGLYHGVARTWLNPASVSSSFLLAIFYRTLSFSDYEIQTCRMKSLTLYVSLQMQIFTRLDKVAEAVKGWNLDVMPDNTSATLQQVRPS